MDDSFLEERGNGIAIGFDPIDRPFGYSYQDSLLGHFLSGGKQSQVLKGEASEINSVITFRGQLARNLLINPSIKKGKAKAGTWTYYKSYPRNCKRLASIRIRKENQGKHMACKLAWKDIYCSQ